MTCILSIGLTRAEVLGKGKLGTEASGPSPSDGSAVVHDGCWPTETEPEHKKRTTHVLILRTTKKWAKSRGRTRPRKESPRGLLYS